MGYPTHRAGTVSYLGVQLGGVYLVNSAGTNHYKVGHSENIRRRINDLTTAHPNKFIPTDAFSFLEEAQCRGDSVLARAMRMQIMGLHPSIVQSVLLAESIDEATKALRAIAHGDVHSPGGIEGLTMAIAGDGLRDSLVAAIRESADAVEPLTGAVEDVGKAIAKLREAE